MTHEGTRKIEYTPVHDLLAVLERIAAALERIATRGTTGGLR